MRITVDNETFFGMLVEEGAGIQVARGGTNGTLILVDRGYGQGDRTISFYLTDEERRQLITQLQKADRYTLVESGEGDWCGLYRQGKLIDEGHISTVREFLPDALDIPIDVVYPDDQWIRERGRLPKTLDEVVLKEG